MSLTDPLVVGKITTVYGVKGWVKVHSFTQPADNIFDYRPWWINTAQGWRELQIDQHRLHQHSFVVHVKGIDDRDAARLLCQLDIAVEKSQLHGLEDGEYYWHQLIGLGVVSHYQGKEYRLGSVKEMLETGANDVFVVQGDSDSIDTQERLIPYVDQFVTKIDLQAQKVVVDWDPEF